MPIVREVFRRGYEFVAVRRIRITSKKHIEIGQSINKSEYKTHQLMNWYRQRRIGVKGSAWSNAMVGDQRPYAKPELSKEKEQPVSENMSKKTKGKVKKKKPENENLKPWENEE